MRHGPVDGCLRWQWLVTAAWRAPNVDVVCPPAHFADVPPACGLAFTLQVGFEVVACSIERKPGEPINKSLMCPQSYDDPNAPKAQEVKKGEGWAGWSNWLGKLYVHGTSRVSRRVAFSRRCLLAPAGVPSCTVSTVTHMAPCPASSATHPAPGAPIVYTYDVYWDTSDIPWSSRWDAYLRMPGGKVHWFSILNSLMVVVSVGWGRSRAVKRGRSRAVERGRSRTVERGRSRAGRGLGRSSLMPSTHPLSSSPHVPKASVAQHGFRRWSCRASWP